MDNRRSIDITPTTSQQAVNDFKKKYPRNRLWQLAVDGAFYSKEYELNLMSNAERNPGVIYLKDTTEGLQYEVIGHIDGELKSNTIPWDTLPQDFPRNLSDINLPEKKFLSILLNHLSNLGHACAEKRVSQTERGWLNYEAREPGSLKGFFSSLNIALRDMDDLTISLNLIKDLHRAVISHVKNYNSKLITPGEFRHDTDAWFHLNRGNITEEGLTDLLNKIEAGELNSVDTLNGGMISIYADSEYLEITKKTIVNIKDGLRVNGNLPNTTNETLAHYLISLKRNIRYDAPKSREVEALLQPVIDHYNTSVIGLQNTMNNTSDPDVLLKLQDELLVLIGKTIQAFERIHPFPDANGRTFVNLLLNRMLLQHGYPPATFFQPNIFDAYGEHVNVLKNAMKNTLDIYAEKNIFGFNQHTQISQNRQSLFFNEMHELKEFSSISHPSEDITSKEFSDEEKEERDEDQVSEPAFSDMEDDISEPAFSDAEIDEEESFSKDDEENEDRHSKLSKKT